MTKLSKALTTRANRLAHRVGQQHEAAIRRDLMQRLLDARTGGASFDQLNLLLDDLEQNFSTTMEYPK